MNNISSKEAHNLLQVLSSLKSPEKKNHKLCFYENSITSEEDSPLYRTSISYLRNLTGGMVGWSRDLTNLNPLIERSISVLITESEVDVDGILEKEIKEAIDGLVVLQKNKYQGSQNEKLIEIAIENLLKSIQSLKSKKTDSSNIEEHSSDFLIDEMISEFVQIDDNQSIDVVHDINYYIIIRNNFYSLVNKISKNFKILQPETQSLDEVKNDIKRCLQELKNYLDIFKKVDKSQPLLKDEIIFIKKFITDTDLQRNLNTMFAMVRKVYKDKNFHDLKQELSELKENPKIYEFVLKFSYFGKRLPNWKNLLNFSIFEKMKNIQESLKNNKGIPSDIFFSFDEAWLIDHIDVDFFKKILNSIPVQNKYTPINEAIKKNDLDFLLNLINPELIFWLSTFYLEQDIENEKIELSKKELKKIIKVILKEIQGSSKNLGILFEEKITTKIKALVGKNYDMLSSKAKRRPLNADIKQKTILFIKEIEEKKTEKDEALDLMEIMTSSTIELTKSNSLNFVGWQPGDLIFHQNDEHHEYACKPHSWKDLGQKLLTGEFEHCGIFARSFEGDPLELGSFDSNVSYSSSTTFGSQYFTICYRLHVDQLISENAKKLLKMAMHLDTESKLKNRLNMAKEIALNEVIKTPKKYEHIKNNFIARLLSVVPHFYIPTVKNMITKVTYGKTGQLDKILEPDQEKTLICSAFVALVLSLWISKTEEKIKSWILEKIDENEELKIEISNLMNKNPDKNEMEEWLKKQKFMDFSIDFDTYDISRLHPGELIKSLELLNSPGQKPRFEKIGKSSLFTKQEKA